MTHEDLRREQGLLLSLRERLYSAPSEALWCELWQLMEATSSTSAGASDSIDVEAVIDYANDHMSSWSTRLRGVRLEAGAPWLQAPSPCIPLVRHIEITFRDPQGRELLEWLRSPWCVSLPSLHIKGPALELYGGRFVLGDEVMAALLSSPAFSNLRHLRLSRQDIDMEAFERLMASPLLSSLERLELTGVGLCSCAGLIAGAPQLSQLTHLNLSDNLLNAQDWRALLESESLCQLQALLLQQNDLSADQDTVFDIKSPSHATPIETLCIGRNDFPPGWCERFTHNPRWQGLRFLDLRNTQSALSDWRKLWEWGGCQSLRRLGVSGSIRSPEHCQVLADSTQLEALQALDVSGCQLGRRGLMTLLGEAGIGANLRQLNISRNAADGVFLAALSEQPLLQTLTQLDLSSSCLDQEGTERFFTSPVWGKGLRQLTLVEPFLHDEVRENDWMAALLGRTRSTQALSSLTLSGCGFSAAAWCQLFEEGQFSQLKRLGLNDTSFGQKAFQAFLQAPWLSGLEQLSLACWGVPEEQLFGLSRHEGMSALSRLTLEGTDFTLGSLLSFLEGPAMARLLQLDVAVLPHDLMAAAAHFDTLPRPVHLSQLHVEALSGFPF